MRWIGLYFGRYPLQSRVWVLGPFRHQSKREYPCPQSAECLNSDYLYTFCRKIHDALKPSAFTIQNDSAKHAGHAGNPSKDPNAETHFNVSIESSAFAGKSLVQQHRMVYDLLSEEFDQGLHALALKTKAPSQWQRWIESSVAPYNHVIVKKA